MTTLLSPFAPLHSWLYDALNVMAPIHVVYGPLTDDAPVEVIDLRDLQTRAVVLSALAAAGHSLPWALGGIWSPLTGEQAGRVVAEIVRAIGADPKCPTSVVPTCILDPWSYSGDLTHDWRRSVRIGQPHPDLQDGPHVTGDDPQYIIAGYGPGWGYGWWTPRLGRETCAAGRAASDAHSAGLGALLWEQVTP